MVKTKKIDVIGLKTIYHIRQKLDEDAVQRYIELYQGGKEKNITIQKDTNVVIDGFHRIEAIKRLGLKSISVNVKDIPNNEIRTLAYKYNKTHGVPLSKDERDQLIVKLYLEDGKTQQQIAKLTDLDQSTVSDIISNMGTHKINNNGKTTDKRRELTNKDEITITRLILAREKQDDIAEKFGVSQGRISQIWSDFRDKVYKLYTENKLLKNEVIEKVELTADEIDKILQEYGDPLNFDTKTSTWWEAFGLDNRFGQKHPSNIPADLVRNILALYTKPGDVILDPAAGGGVVIDVAKDMVNRKCYAFDLTPTRSDIQTYNLLSGSLPKMKEVPNLIFLDLPYGPIKEYSTDSEDLASLNIQDFLKSLEQIFSLWSSGVLVVLMSSYRGKEGFIDLPFETEKRMINAGWKIIEHIVNEHGKRTVSETGYWIAQAKKDRWLLRKHIHILVGQK